MKSSVLDRLRSLRVRTPLAVPIRPGRAISRLRRPAATATEFAVVSSVFLAFVLGFIELGRGFMIQHLMTNAARQGCRVAVIEGKSTTDVNNAVYAVLNGQGVSGDTVTLQVNDVVGNPSSANSGDEISVTVAVPVSSISWVPVSNYLFGSISGKYTLRRE